MPNKNYLSGRRREYSIMNKLKSKGLIVFRTAGSHGIVDLIAIDKIKKSIGFIQVKPKSMSKAARMRIEASNDWLNNEWLCYFKVVSFEKEI